MTAFVYTTAYRYKCRSETVYTWYIWHLSSECYLRSGYTLCVCL